ncbi:uncharacterized protein LOC134845189 [Symsagittifera roscoffensis]|uniref:uncharacterized protein LOC134845189 n=1 Tax=Symsagittifera roscoffensis TaxID=84072 RepID=UPI00307C5378
MQQRIWILLIFWCMLQQTTARYKKRTDSFQVTRRMKSLPADSTDYDYDYHFANPDWSRICLEDRFEVERRHLENFLMNNSNTKATLLSLGCSKYDHEFLHAIYENKFKDQLFEIECGGVTSFLWWNSNNKDAIKMSVSPTIPTEAEINRAHGETDEM